MHLFINSVLLSCISSKASQGFLLELLVAPENDLLDVSWPLVLLVYISAAWLHVNKLIFWLISRAAGSSDLCA